MQTQVRPVLLFERSARARRRCFRSMKLNVSLTGPWAITAAHAVVTRAARFEAIDRPAEQAGGDRSNALLRSDRAALAMTMGPDTGDANDKIIVGETVMSFRIVAIALLASLLAGAVIAHQPRLIGLGAASGTARLATGVHTVVAPRVYALAAPPADRTSSNVGDAGSRNQSAPAPDFAGPGPGWG